MIVDAFRSQPGFPFDRYFDSVNHYLLAQAYWLRLLRGAPGFAERDWTPKLAEPDTAAEMYTGRVCYLLSSAEPKELMLHTASVAGLAHMLLQENAGLTPEDYAAQKAVFGPDFTLDDRTLGGIGEAEAWDEARETLAQTPVSAWVEPARHWQPDPAQPEGGSEIGIERLVVTSVISDRAELGVLDALARFLAPGPAMQRVNAVHAPQ